MLSLRIAWRNLWRNWKRTLINLLAMSISSATLVGGYALAEGTIDELVRKATTVLVGEAQVHGKGFLPDRAIYSTLANPDAIATAAHSAGLATAPRGIGFGLISVGAQSGGVQFWGVVPKAELAVGELARTLQEGTFLTDAPSKQVVLGRLLSKNLNAHVGSEVVAVLQAADGSTRSALFKVVGVLGSVGDDVDRRAALIHLEDFQNLFEVPGKIHEIVVTSRGQKPLEAVISAVETAAGSDEVRSWHALLPSISHIIELVRIFHRLSTGLLFLTAGLGVLNTMLMSSFERIPEFGVLKAIGTEPWRIVRDVALEALVLGGLAGCAGLAAGLPFALYTQIHGIARPSASGAGGVAFDATWHGTLTVEGIVVPVVLCWIVSVAAALYPAIKASRIDPIRALTHV